MSRRNPATTRWSTIALATLMFTGLATGLATGPAPSAEAATGPAPSAEVAVPTKSQWLADVNRAMAGSRVYVGKRVSQTDSKLAVNLDIDNTALASHYDYGHPVAVVLRFARYAAGHQVAVLFNTGRIRGGGRLAKAEHALREAGYPVTEICGRSGSSESLSHSKQRCRRHFVSQGYRIIANVGNRGTDFTGRDYERAFRLPNYHDQLA